MPCPDCSDDCGRGMIDTASMPVYVCGGNISVSSSNTEVLLLCDTVAPGDVTRFLRHITFDANGPEIVVDTELDGITPYTVVGTLGTCPEVETDALVLCDILPAPDEPVPFIRHLRYQGGLVIAVFNTELDGISSYTPVGTIGICTNPAPVVQTPIYSTVRQYETASSTPVPFVTAIPANTREISISNLTASDLDVAVNLGSWTVPALGTFIATEPFNEDQVQAVFSGNLTVTYLHNVGPNINGVSPRVLINYKRY